MDIEFQFNVGRTRVPNHLNKVLGIQNYTTMGLNCPLDLYGLVNHLAPSHPLDPRPVLCFRSYTFSLPKMSSRVISQLSIGCQIDITTYQIRKIKADTSLCLFADDYCLPFRLYSDLCVSIYIGMAGWSEVKINRCKCLICYTLHKDGWKIVTIKSLP